MTQTAHSTVAALGADDVARGATIAGVTIVVVLAALLVVGLVLLFRRRAGAQPSGAAGLSDLRTRAGVLLVRADEAVSSGQDELDFASAQFGELRTAAFTATLASARTSLAEAFRLQQALDDSVPDSVQKQREWTLRVIALCEEAVATLAGQDRDFSALRSEEADAPARIASLRARLDLVRGRLEPVAATLARLTSAYAAPLLTSLDGAVEQARSYLDAAEKGVDDAAARLSPAGVNAVAALLTHAEESLRAATSRLDAVESRDGQLAAAASALEALVATSLDDLAEARAQRDTAPEAETGAAIIAAMSAVERQRSAVAEATGPRDPVAELDALGSAVSELDTALASARNQAQRLEHARTALEGTLVSATSQISALRALIAAGGRRVGADARTRLAEAERQLQLAGVEADPVEALDAARRAVTSARDGDALAHYDAMQL